MPNLELWMNCDSRLLVFNPSGKGFINNNTYKAYIAFAYDCLRAAVEIENKNDETKKIPKTS